VRLKSLFFTKIVTYTCDRSGKESLFLGSPE
jgi:hypothetical protein